MNIVDRFVLGGALGFIIAYSVGNPLNVSILAGHASAIAYAFVGTSAQILIEMARNYEEGGATHE